MEKKLYEIMFHVKRLLGIIDGIKEEIVGDDDQTNCLHTKIPYVKITCAFINNKCL